MKHPLLTLSLSLTGLAASFSLAIMPVHASELIAINSDQSFDIATYDSKEPTKVLILATTTLSSTSLTTDTLTLGLLAGQPVTIASMQELGLEAIPLSGGSITTQNTCNSGVSSMMTITAGTDASVQVRVSQNRCSNTDLRTVNLVTPTISTVSLNDNSWCTTTPAITVTVGTKDAVQLLLSNDQSFSDTDWSHALAVNSSPITVPWTLTATEGQKTVYVLAKSSTGTISQAASASIKLSAVGTCVSADALVNTIIDTKISDRTNIHVSEDNTVHYRTDDSKFYVFPDEAALESWYSVPIYRTEADKMEAPSNTLYGIVGYKPGAVLIVPTDSSKVYAVGHHGSLRWINTEQVANELYGSNWKSMLNWIAPENMKFFTIDAPIVNAADFNLSEMLNSKIEDELLTV